MGVLEIIRALLYNPDLVFMALVAYQTSIMAMFLDLYRHGFMTVSTQIVLSASFSFIFCRFLLIVFDLIRDLVVPVDVK